MKNFIDTEAYKNIINNKINCYFISPHLDDAVFSACNLMIDLINNGVNVNVINVFTKPSSLPYTLSVKKFLNVCGYRDADLLYKARIKEDADVMNKIGAKVINLGFVDALWRRKNVTGFLKLLSKYIPEFDYVYPIYRLSIALGRISKKDKNLFLNMSKKLDAYIKPSNNFVIFCPVAVGKHVDHLIVRQTCAKKYNKNIVIYWTDYPYEDKHESDERFVAENNLELTIFTKTSQDKNDIVNSYYSQNKIIFGNNRDHSKTTEKYYFKRSK